MIQLFLKYIQAGAFLPGFLLQIYLPQEHHSEFEPDKAHSTVVGIICPLVEIGLTVTQHLGKARVLEALVAVAPLHCTNLFSLRKIVCLLFGLTVVPSDVHREAQCRASAAEPTWSYSLHDKR